MTDRPLRKFRFHRGTLTESLETTIIVESEGGLYANIAIRFGNEVGDVCWPRAGQAAPLESMTIKPYGYDPRINWDTYIVCLNGQAVGFLDGPL